MSQIFPIEDDPRFRILVASAGQTTFAIPFPFQANADVIALEKVDDLFFEIVGGYTVTGAGNPSGGTLTFSVGREENDEILILGSAVLERLTSIVLNGRFSSKATDDELDRNRLIQQEVKREVDRAVKTSYGEVAPTLDLNIPDGRALIRMGQRLIAGPNAQEISSAQGYAESAAQSASFAAQFAKYNYSSGQAFTEANIPAPVLYVDLAGYSSPGDGGGHRKVRIETPTVIEPWHTQTADGAWWTFARQHFTVTMFGAKGDGINDDAAVINTAIAAVSALGGGTLWFPPGEYRVGQTIKRKSRVWLVAAFGTVRLKLTNNANCTIIEDDGFETWDAWTSGSLDGYPMEMGIDGFILDGNAENQGAGVSADLASLVYGFRSISHRHTIGRLQIDNVKGVGIHTKYNTAIVSAVRTAAEHDPYGMAGSVLATNAPHSFGHITVSDCLYEHFVFAGPADINTQFVSTNYCGWLAGGSEPAAPRTSLLFAGQEIHSFRAEVACQIDHANLNDALYGRSLYVAPFVRFTGGTVIASSSWGAVLIDRNAFGSIANLTLQQNKYSWGGVYKPYLECVKGLGSGAIAGKFSFPQITCRRLGTDSDSIGPFILDNAGQQFGIIDGFDGNPTTGHGVIIGSTSIGTSIDSIQLDSLQGTASDGTPSCGLIIQSGARDWRVGHARITDCAVGVKNLGVASRGVIENGVIEVNTGVTGQVALEGVCSSSQLAVGSGGSGAVVVNGNSISRNDLPEWGLQIIDAGTRYWNQYRGQVSFDTTATGAVASSAIAHNMWRTPDNQDVTTSLRWGGTTWPAGDFGIRTLTPATFTAAGFVRTASAGTLSMAVIIN